MKASIDLKDRLDQLALLTENLNTVLNYVATRETAQFKNMLFYASCRRFFCATIKFWAYISARLEFATPIIADTDVIEQLVKNAVAAGLFLESDRQQYFFMASIAADQSVYTFEYEPIPKMYLKKMRILCELLKKFIDAEYASLGQQVPFLIAEQELR